MPDKHCGNGLFTIKFHVFNHFYKLGVTSLSNTTAHEHFNEFIYRTLVSIYEKREQMQEASYTLKSI